MITQQQCHLHNDNATLKNKILLSLGKTISKTAQSGLKSWRPKVYCNINEFQLKKYWEAHTFCIFSFKSPISFCLVLPRTGEGIDPNLKLDVENNTVAFWTVVPLVLSKLSSKSLFLLALADDNVCDAVIIFSSSISSFALSKKCWKWWGRDDYNYLLIIFGSKAGTCKFISNNINLEK